MIEISILNMKSKETFKKQFQSPFLARKFLAKAKKSKQIRVVSMTGSLAELYE